VGVVGIIVMRTDMCFMLLAWYWTVCCYCKLIQFTFHAHM